jgi:hypothetical protein
VDGGRGVDEGVGRGGKQHLIFLGDLDYQISLLEAKTRMLVQTKPLLTSWKAMEAQSC